MMAILTGVRWYFVVVLTCVLTWFFSVLLRRLFMSLALFELGYEGGWQDLFKKFNKQVNAALISHYREAGVGGRLFTLSKDVGWSENFCLPHLFICFSAYVSKGEAVGSLCLKKKKQTKTLALKSHRLAFRTWAKYSTSLCLRFLICEMGITCHEVVEKLKEIQ